jgi:hypothetical protein
MAAPGGPAATVGGRVRHWARGTIRSFPSHATINARSKQRRDPPVEGDRIGICCSGGGIRSAAYNLGALQTLQAEGILHRSRYLSAVSGGSYIAASFAMVEASRRKLAEEGEQSDPPTFAPNTPEERYLRNHSSYLASGLRGKASLAGSLLAGIALNVILLGALIVLVARGAGTFGAWLHPELTEVAGPQAPAWLRSTGPWLLGGLLGAGLAAMLASSALPLRDAAQRRMTQVAHAALLAGAVLFGAGVALPWLLGASMGDQTARLTGVVEGIATRVNGTAVVGVLSALGLTGAVAGVVRAWLSEHRSRVAVLAGGLVVPAALAGVLIVVSYRAAAQGVVWAQAGWAAGALAVLIVFHLVTDLTSSSLHPFYKRRLSSAFALRRRWDGGALIAEERPYEDLIPLTEAQPPDWPTLVVCAAANISDGGVTPPGRRAATFTFSAEEVGGPEVGYVPTDEFLAALGPRRRKDTTLPAAVAMSGAAVSPSMGKMTMRPLTFLLALANARLGVWMPNPTGVANSDAGTWRHRARITWLWREMRGKNRLAGRFLYVSDGGHYENLGLVELLRRGCTEIYCFDASGDQVDTFFTLGQAVALARSELQVSIDINPAAIRQTEPGGPYCSTDHVVGDITYPGGRTGTIVFAKAGVVEDAPWDVRAYGERDPAFPTHSTVDQFYTDEKFEAYRALGAHTARRALRSLRLHPAPQTTTPSPETPAEPVSTPPPEPPVTAEPPPTTEGTAATGATGSAPPVLRG